MPLRDPRGIVLDLLAVVVFVGIGRMQHDGGRAFAPAGFAETLWPFVGGLVIGWVVLAVLRSAYRSPVGGGTLIVATVVGGLCLRYASGQGIAVSFAIVTLVVIGVLMLGWRLLFARLT